MTIFLAGLMICAVAIVWFSLLIRKALLLVAIVLAPVAFAGAAWDVTRSWIGKWAAFVVALIVSKLVLVVVFLIAITQVATPIEADLSAVTVPITGIVLLSIAAFAPYMVYRFISFLGFDLYHAMGTEQEAKNALNQPVPVPSKPKSDGVKKILDGSDDTGSAPSGGSAPPTTTAPTTGSTAATTETAGAGGGAAAAAGPAAAVIVGAEVAETAAEARPTLGHEVGDQAESAADAADQPGSTPPPEQSDPGAPPPSAPQPNQLSSDPAPPPTEPKPPADPPVPQQPKE